MKDTLHIAIFVSARNKTLLEGLLPCIRNRGHTVEVFSLPYFGLSELEIDRLVERVNGFDVVYQHAITIPWIEVELTDKIESKGIRYIGTPVRYYPYIRNKAFQIYKMSSLGIRSPKSIYARFANYQRLVKGLGLPFVTKALTGYGGNEIFLISSEQDFLTLFPKNGQTSRSRRSYLFQEYIPHSFECRVHIVAGKAISTYQKEVGVDDFRSNVLQGGREKSIDKELVPELFSSSEKIAQLFRIEIGAIDFMYSEDTGELYFTECNVSPAWDRVDAVASGVDMGSKIVDYIELVAS